MEARWKPISEDISTWICTRWIPPATGLIPVNLPSSWSLDPCLVAGTCIHKPARLTPPQSLSPCLPVIRPQNWPLETPLLPGHFTYSSSALVCALLMIALTHTPTLISCCTLQPVVCLQWLDSHRHTRMFPE